jgi:hypothetical protein
MSQQNQVQNKPTAAYILALVGGILGLLGSITLIILGATANYAYNSFAGYFGAYTPFGLGWSLLIGLGVWMLISSILITVFAIKLNANPLEHTKWGALILVFSFIGLGGGLLGMIGGILALFYKPILVGAAQQYVSSPQAYGPPSQQQPMTRVCPQCGRIVQANERFCPNCGKQLY